MYIASSGPRCSSLSVDHMRANEQYAQTATGIYYKYMLIQFVRIYTFASRYGVIVMALTEVR